MHDWIWSVSITFFAYLFVNYGPPQIFNVPMAYFTINWIQPLIACAGVMSGLYSIARLGLYFNIRRMHVYMYGEKKGTNKITDYLKKELHRLETGLADLESGSTEYNLALSMIAGIKKEIEEARQYENKSSTDFKTLHPWQRLAFLSLYLLFFFVAALIVFLKFIPLNAPA